MAFAVRCIQYTDLLYRVTNSYQMLGQPLYHGCFCNFGQVYPLKGCEHVQGQAPDPKDSAIRIVDAPGAKLYVKVSIAGQRLTVVSQAHEAFTCCLCGNSYNSSNRCRRDYITQV